MQERIDSQELQTRYADGERNFDGVDLQGAGLRGARLAGISLQSSNLRGADLTAAVLPGADLSAADLYEARLEQANLREANLGEAFLDSITARGANLRSSNLTGASLRGADLAGADLRQSDLSDCVCTRADFRKARLDGANLLCAFLEEAQLRESALNDSDVRGASFRGASLEKTQVAGLRFDRRTRFRRSSLEGMIGDPVVARFAKDQEYVEAFAIRHPLLFRIWAISSDCGRSMGRWLLCSGVLAIGFGLAFSLLSSHFMLVPSREATPFTLFYYSIVTFTTLGFGDVVPRSGLGEVLIAVEVLLGYVMLGGLVSIFANKIARRS